MADEMDREDRKVVKVDPKMVKKNDLMAFTYYAKVDSTNHDGTRLSVRNTDSPGGFDVHGKSLVEGSSSADFYGEEQFKTKTELAQLLVESHNRPFTVVFMPQDAKKGERTLRGRLVKHEALLGRSYVEDLDVPLGEHRLRQVDHRTISSLIVDGVKYTLKGKK